MPPKNPSKGVAAPLTSELIAAAPPPPPSRHPTPQPHPPSRRACPRPGREARQGPPCQLPLPGAARRVLLAALQRLDQRFNLIAPPAPLDAETRARLTEDYREDIVQLQDLIGRDLSHWL